MAQSYGLLARAAENLVLATKFPIFFCGKAASKSSQRVQKGPA